MRYLFLLFISASLFAGDAEILQHAQKTLPHYGVLTQKGNGFTYLKVSDNYIHELFELIDDAEFKKPPYFRRADAPGAHVSVLYEKEGENAGLIKQLGKPFSFQISEVARVKVRNEKEYLILRVVSPELEQFRMSLGLKPKLQGHDFHISIAVKKL
ncbi:MAG: hypothetical protein JSR37_01905 [Verrucomicrobia bacterium]|nr:hypothetical protein [Verrucomicrobiota bacterium]MBS0635967.1 hypothetical protein [Verrucomicrobiota bacterium]